MPRSTQAKIDAIYSRGLHEFLRDFIADNNRLGAAIAEQYLFWTGGSDADSDRLHDDL